jgi:hypothetical protein
MKKDYNKIAKYEKAIKDKYGQEAIENPKNSWSKEKENIYLRDLKAFYSPNKKVKKITSEPGFEIIEKTTTKDCTRECPVCDSYSMKAADDLYMLKFECCFDCYIQYVEGREERWKTGWRPKE